MKLSDQTCRAALAALERDLREINDQLGTPDGGTAMRVARQKVLSTAIAEITAGAVRDMVRDLDAAAGGAA